MKEIIKRDPAVEQVGDLLTMQLSPEQVLLNVDIRFRGGIDVRQLESAIDRIEKQLREKEPSIERLFIEADSLKTVAGDSSKAA